MNRKMRAKLNNQKARAKRERALCPMTYKVLHSEHCDLCEEKLINVATLQREHKETRH